MRLLSVALAGGMLAASALLLLNLGKGPFDSGHFRPGSSAGLPMLPSIAHAGGALGDLVGTNSLDALHANRDSYDHFEIDFSWTSDNQLVCLHDWQEAAVARFGAPVDRPMTLAEFETRIQDGGPGNCTVPSLADWLRQHPGKIIVTDIKERNLDGLRLIADQVPDVIGQLLPQAYHPDEFPVIRDLGFIDMIWTLYRYDGPMTDVVTHLSEGGVKAVTMQKRHAYAGLAREIHAATGVPTYVHTVNNPLEAGCFADFGVSGIYTDRLGREFPEVRPGPDCGALLD